MNKMDEPRSILEKARNSIKKWAGKNPNKWFLGNRFVFARLQLDERKLKAKIKKELIASEHTFEFNINDDTGCDAMTLGLAYVGRPTATLSATTLALSASE